MPLRIIARLDIKAPNLVKGVRLEGLRKLGDPSRFAEQYFHQGADEIYYQDIVASLYNRSSILDLVTHTAQNVFIPLAVGGGIRSEEDIQNLLRAGADKVCINTAAVKRPMFIQEMAERFGSQCITVAVETIRQSKDHWEAFTDNGREHTGLDAYDWAQKAVELGCGELFITSVDHEGTGDGFDMDFIHRLSPNVPVPLVVHGGAGHPSHILEAAQAGVDGVAIAQLLHYERCTIADIKQACQEHGTEVRA